MLLHVVVHWHEAVGSHDRNMQANAPCLHSLSHNVIDLSNWDEVKALLSVTRVRISHMAWRVNETLPC